MPCRHLPVDFRHRDNVVIDLDQDAIHSFRFRYAEPNRIAGITHSNLFILISLFPLSCHLANPNNTGN